MDQNDENKDDCDERDATRNISKTVEKDQLTCNTAEQSVRYRVRGELNIGKCIGDNDEHASQKYQNNSTDDGRITDVSNSTEDGWTLEVNNSTEDGRTTDVNNSTEDGRITDVNNSTEDGRITDVNNSTEDGRTTDVNNSTEDGRTTDVNNSTEDGRTTDVNNSTEDGRITDVNNSTEDGRTTDGNNSREDGRTTDVNNSTEDVRTTDVNNSTEDGRTTDVNNSTEDGRTTDVNNSTEDGRTTDVNNSTEDGRTTDVNNSTEDGRTTDVNNSTEDGRTTDVNNSTEDGRTTDVNNSTDDGRTTDVNNSTEDGRTTDVNNSTEDGRTTDVNNSTEDGRTTDVNNSTEDGRTTDVNNSTEDGRITDVNNSTEDGRTTDVNNSTEDGRTTDVNNSTEDGRTTDVNNSTEDGRTTDVNNSTKDGRTTDVNNCTEDGRTTDVNNSTKDGRITDVNNSTEDGRTTDVNNSTEGGRTTDVNNSTEDGRTLEVNNCREDGRTLDVNNSTEDGRTLEVNNSTEDGRTTDVNNSTEDGRTPEVNNSTEDGRTPEVNNSTEDGRTPEVNNSTEDGRTQEVNNSTEDGRTTDVNNSTEDGRITDANSSTEVSRYSASSGNSTDEEDYDASPSIPSVGSQNDGFPCKTCPAKNEEEVEEPLEALKSLFVSEDDTNNENSSEIIIEAAEDHEEVRQLIIQDYTSDDRESLNATMERLPDDICRVSESGSSLCEDDSKEIDKQLPMYRTNSSRRTLNQSVRTHVISPSIRKRIYRHSSTTTADKVSKNDLGWKVCSRTKSDLPLRPTPGTCSRSIDKQQRESPVPRTQRCRVSSFVICTHCENRSLARYSCEDCFINCCSECIYALHPRQTRYKKHVILKGHTVLHCEVHDEPLDWYCVTCDHPICAASLAYSGHILHDVEKMEVYVKNEKKQLLDLQREVGSRCLEKAHVSLTTLQEYEESIRLEWIHRKQHIQREFATLRQVVGETEDTLIKDGQKDFDSRIRHLSTLRCTYGEVVDREARLAQISLDSVSGTPKSHFLKSVKSIQEKLSRFQQETEAIPTVNLADVAPSATHLSLFPVTTYLQQLKSKLGSSTIRPYQRVLFVPEAVIRAPITTHDLWNISDNSLQSVSLVYSIEIKEGCCSKGHLWKGMVSPGGILFNVSDMCFLDRSSRYLVKVTPHFRTMTGFVTYETTRGKPCHIFIITATDAMDESPDQIILSRLQIDFTNLSQSFEETRLAFKKHQLRSAADRMVSKSKAYYRISRRRTSHLKRDNHSKLQVENHATQTSTRRYEKHRKKKRID
ncbi:uncharacterized protein LOC117325783 [Pecten maximus]|uniref:uncharacterized protein LOC117325783 n=1 Tax=Pecten maximus TaxID=6579 RepID=UPI001458936B|nr:uncharacterized protein LOC117325783 [Pecten maximus]